MYDNEINHFWGEKYPIFSMLNGDQRTQPHIPHSSLFQDQKCSSTFGFSIIYCSVSSCFITVTQNSDPHEKVNMQLNWLTFSRTKTRLRLPHLAIHGIFVENKRGKRFFFGENSNYGHLSANTLQTCKPDAHSLLMYHVFWG